MRRVHHAAVAAVAVTAALSVAALGCGVPTDSGARGIDADDVPDGLLAVPTSTTSPRTDVVATSTSMPLPAGSVKVFLVDPLIGRVVPVDRSTTAVADGTVLGAAQLAIDVLLQEPLLPLEQAVGLSTTLSATSLRAVRVEDGVLDIDVSQLPRRLPDQPLAAAQIVLTVTSVVGVTHVRMLRDGEPFPVPVWIGDFAAPDDPVERLDYLGAIGSVSPPPTTTTTVPTTTTQPTTTMPADAPESTAVPGETTVPPPEPADPAPDGQEGPA
jgi:hypothetical protein